MGERGRKFYPLTNSVNGNPKERRNAKKKGEKKESRDRGSTFSLDSLEIESSSSSEARGKVSPHRRSFA